MQLRPIISLILIFVFLSLSGEVFGLAESTGPDGSNAQTLWQRGYTGQGINVAVITVDNARISHEVFKDDANVPHAYSYDFTGDGVAVSNHDTWVAGIVASRGSKYYSQYENDKGVAFSCDIYSAKIGKQVSVSDPNRFITFEFAAAALKDMADAHNCRVVVSGLAFDPAIFTPNGESEYTLLYDYYACTRNIVFTNAAGNSDTQIAVFGDCYNGITTGGLIVTEPNVYQRVGSLSGSGPTADGRLKPDVTAPSQDQTIPSGSSDTSWTTFKSSGGQTSFSSPHTAGAAALLLQYADSTAEPCDIRHEVIKAVIVNSAFPNIRKKNNTSTTGEVKDYDRGYGRIDAYSAYQTLAAGRIQRDIIITADEGWAYDNIEQNTTHIYQINVPKSSHLLITLTWDREVIWQDEPANRPRFQDGIIQSNELHSSPAANLDLKVYRADDMNVPLFGGLATKDNLEKCDILTPISGVYIVKIVNNDILQIPNYALAFKVVPQIRGDWHLDYAVNNLDLLYFASLWLDAVAPENDLAGNDLTFTFADFAIYAQNRLVTSPVYYPY